MNVLCKENEPMTEIISPKRKKSLKKFSAKWNLKVNLHDLNDVLTHSSFKVYDSTSNDYQSWEILGDAVLDLIVVDILLFEYDIKNEGLLTTIRSSLVSNKALIHIERELDLTNLLRTSDKYKIQHKDQADIVEAFFGLLYKSMGLNFTKQFFKKFYGAELKSIVFNKQITFEKTGKVLSNAKNTLQEYCQKNKLPLPKYTILHEKGVPHHKTFLAECQIITADNRILREEGLGKNKKDSEKKAAMKLCKKLDIQ